MPLAITIDDLPAHGALPPGEKRLTIADGVVAALKSAHAPAIGFVNGSFGAGDPDAARALDRWRRAGLPVGNHGYRHLALGMVAVDAFVADLDRNAVAVPGLVKRFRYPFLDEGRDPAMRDAVRRALADRGYRIASATLSFADYAWNEAYVRCRTQGDGATVASLELGYLAAARADADRGLSAARAAGRPETPQVLLLHLGALTARMLPRLLQLYRDMGFRFTTLDAAQRDRFYRATDPRRPGPTATLADPARSGGIALPPAPRPPGAETCPAR